MSRTIKFRIWNNIKNHFENNGDGCDLSNIVWLENNGFIDANDKNYVFQQYIGLLDKNNKEIYEGDIVKITSLKQNFIGEIVYDESSFKLKNEFGYCFLLEYYCNSCIEKMKKAFNNSQLDISNELSTKIEIISNIFEK